MDIPFRVPSLWLVGLATLTHDTDQRKCKGGFGSASFSLTAILCVGSLSLDKLRRVVVDASHVDGKRRGIFDMQELQAPLLDFLSTGDLKERYGETTHGVDLLFY
jgi:U3-containing 90S pre-ribosomal complex subunit